MTTRRNLAVLPGRKFVVFSIAIACAGIASIAAFSYVSMSKPIQYVPPVHNDKPPTPHPKPINGEHPDIGPYSCGTPSKGLLAESGWKVATSTYTCLEMLLPEHWYLANSLGYTLPGQANSVTVYTDDGIDEIGRPVFALTPITELDGMISIVGEDLNTIQKTKPNIGTTKLQVFDLGVQKDESSGHDPGFKHEFFVLHDSDLSRTYLVEAFYFPTPFVTKEYPNGFDFVKFTRTIVRSMKSF